MSSTVSTYSLFSTLFLCLSALRAVNSEALASPIYEYLKDLCPTGQLPLTSSKTVKTCANLCPLGAMCYRGICCVPPPQCRHPSYRISTGFPCLPNVKNHCPDGSQCVSSSQDGMYVCCSSRNIEKSFPSSRLKPLLKSTTPNKKATEKLEKSSLVEASSPQICPKSHPIIAHDGKSLVLCKDCVQGVCAKFRTSNVEVCCQNSDDICGPGSQVLMDSHVPRDCSKKPCGKGYECSLTPSGLRVCCSLAKCPNGQFARSVCAAGCLRNEKCMAIQEEMWCCPSEERTLTKSTPPRADLFLCKDGSRGTGEKCDPAFPICSRGASCELNQSGSAHICCRRYSSKLASRKTLVAPPFFFTTTTPPTTTTEERTTTQEPYDVVPNCLSSQSRPLIENGLPYICAHPGDTCIRPGYTCQESDIDEVFVCCTVRAPPQIPIVFPVSASTTTPEPLIEEVKATCPFSYMPSKNEHGEAQRCLTLFSLDCPFGYTCLPSSTTDSYLCCIRKPVV